MKANKLLLAAAAFAGLALLSFAGPGPDYRARMTESAKARAAAPAKIQPATPVASCAACSCAAMKKS